MCAIVNKTALGNERTAIVTAQHYPQGFNWDLLLGGTCTQCSKLSF